MKFNSQLFLILTLLTALLMPGAPTVAADTAMTPLSAGEKLRHLSLTLRGLEPAVSDLQALAVLTDAQGIQQFLEATARKYVRSEAFAAKVVEKFSEVSGLVSPALPAESLWQKDLTSASLFSVASVWTEQKELTISTTHNLLRDVVIENQPWDQVLLARSLKLPRGNYNLERVSDRDADLLRDYFTRSGTSSSGSDQQREDAVVTLPKTEHRFSGLLTLSTFSRATLTNPKTQYDEISDKPYYRRAARLLRMFHCENLKPGNIRGKMETLGDQMSDDGVETHPPLPPPSVAPKTEVQRKVGLVSSQTKAESVPAAHGSNIQCRVCHNKLDPISDIYSILNPTWDKYSRVVPEIPITQLLFADGSQPKVRGIVGLAQAMSASPEFARCQATRFVSWFSPGSKIAPEEKDLFAQKFEELKRRPQDFVVWAVMRDLEKRTTPSLNPKPDSQFPQARAFAELTGQCVACHRASNIKTLPDFSLFLTKSPEGAQWADHIERATDLKGDGHNAKMPPSNGEKLQAKDLTILKNWVSFQRGEIGNQNSSSQASAVSPKKWACYPTAQDYSRRLQQMFGHLRNQLDGDDYDRPKQIENLCDLAKDEEKAYFLGRLHPASGEPQFITPHAEFFTWYKNCVGDLSIIDVSSSLISQDPKIYQPARYLPPTIVAILDAVPAIVPPPTASTQSYNSCYGCSLAERAVHRKNPSLGRKEFLKKPWQQFLPGQQTEIIDHIVNRIFPSGAVEATRLAAVVQRLNQASARELQKFSILEAIARIQRLLLLSRPFLYVNPLCERGAE